jgi:hypothetical protein
MVPLTRLRLTIAFEQLEVRGMMQGVYAGRFILSLMNLMMASKMKIKGLALRQIGLMIVR